MRLCVAFMMVVYSNVFGQTTLEQIRLNYTKAVYDKDICKAMIGELIKSADTPINLAYLGGFRAIWANYVFNSFSKLKTFNQGKNNMEAAVKKDVKNVEIRYIRLSIQKNIPAFLGYKGNIKEDSEFVNQHISSIHSYIDSIK